MTGAALAFSTLGRPGITVDEIADLGRSNEAWGVELRVAEGEVLDASSSGVEAARVGSILQKTGLTLIALNSYVRLCAPLESEEDPVLADLVAHLELASVAGAAGVRVFMQDEPGPAANDSAADRGLTLGESRAVARLAAAQATAERLGVRVLIETHDSHPSGASLTPFLAAQPLGAGALGVIWDTAHSWVSGERLEASLRLLSGWLAHVQIKDIRSIAEPIPSELGAGSFPIDELTAVLTSAGWRGWVSLEWEFAWHPELSPLTDAMTDVRRWAAQLLDPIGTP